VCVGVCVYVGPVMCNVYDILSKCAQPWLTSVDWHSYTVTFTNISWHRFCRQYVIQFFFQRLSQRFIWGRPAIAEAVLILVNRQAIEYFT